MKKILLAFLIFNLIGCVSAKKFHNLKQRDKQKAANIQRWTKQLKQHIFTCEEFEFLINAQSEQ